MKYTKTSASGIGRVGRERLSALFRNTQTTISVLEAANILEMKRQTAGKLLASYAKKGWLTRIKAGVYIPVPIESDSADISLEDPLIIAAKLFKPCYIAGWSAAEHWGLTEQIFQSVMVMTQCQQKNGAMKK